jgi:hypothetical protein
MIAARPSEFYHHTLISRTRLNMNIFIHTSENKKTYISVFHSYFGDKAEGTKIVSEGQTWDTTLFYLGTLTVVFILCFMFRILLIS